MRNLDEILKLGTMFDWITPAVAIAEDISHGGGHTFHIPRDCGLTARQVQKVLTRQGIATWGLTIDDRHNEITITCDKKDAKKAATALRRAGLA
jgi:hypothetical protein